MKLPKILNSRPSYIAPVPKPLLAKDDWWNLPHFPLNNLSKLSECQELLYEAKNYLQGNYLFFNIPYQESPLNWHLDPQTNKLAPLKFGLNLNFRDFNLVGNVKNIWSKNRHHHLTVMTAAYALTGDEEYAEAVAEQLQDWVAKNPFPLGVNWSSSLEVGIRLLSWVWIERFLRTSKVHSLLFGESGILWSSIYWHQWFITKFHSHGSYANNYLIGEMTGLFISSCHWPVFPSSKQWQSLAWRTLEQEISRQTFSCGLNREQAFPHHIFATEFFLLSGLEAQMHKIAITDQYKDLVRKMLEVIPPLIDIGGNLPKYGDSNEDMALQIRPYKSSRLDWLFRLGRQWLSAKVPLNNENSGILAASLVNFPAKDTVKEVPAHSNCVAFPDAGLYVLAQNRGTPQELFCLGDVGSLGFSAIAHGYTDALSFTLNISGVPIIIDPGIYIHDADSLWRNHFRSTKAHNINTIDDLDQSKPEGVFLWSKKAKTKIIDWKQTTDGGILTAEQDAYTRLNEGIIHRRKLSLDRQGLGILDHLQGNGLHEIEWRLHFSSQCRVKLHEQFCLVKWHSGLLVIYLDQQIQWSLLKDEIDGSWHSSAFNVKKTITTLVGTGQIRGSITLNNSLDLLEQKCYRDVTATEVSQII